MHKKMNFMSFLVLIVLFLVQSCSPAPVDNPAVEVASPPQAEEETTLSEEQPTMLPATATLSPTATLAPTMTPQIVEPEPEVNAAVTGTQIYTVRQTLRLVNEGSAPAEKIQLRLALIQSQAPYQEVLSMDISPSNFEILTDMNENEYAEFWMKNVKPGDSRPITIEYEVAVNALDFDLSDCSGDLITGFTSPEQYLESNDSNIRSLAEQLSENTDSLCAVQENIYTHVIDTMWYAGYMPDDIGALAALQKRSGDCTDYADLTIALSRAAGIPARFMEGITYLKDDYYDESQTKHDWLEVYLPGSGWVPMDPTWGEEQSDQYFAGMTPDHIIITKGRNLDLLNNYHYWAFWWWGDVEKVKINVYDEAWLISKK